MALSEKFSFIAINDLHYSSQACRPWFVEVVRQMKASAPDAHFCLLGGDLADNGTAAQLESVRAIFRELAMPVYPVVGNHDYVSGMDRAAYEKYFPGRINYNFLHDGWQVLGLDSSQGTLSRDTMVSDATLHWLDENVPKLDPRKPTIVCTHFPMGRFVAARPRNADELLRRCLQLNVRAIFNGHFHGYTLRQVNDAILTTDRCCSRVRANHDGTPEKGWFVCQASDGDVTRRFVEFRAV